ncbi:Peptidoglycan/xylan/chitin deacetylase, PgdA/CDA1 family [Actinokineospora alba]|uniref:Peptidoglycan/xylan/chitin deacetylase, PgdA/CDA1 family n=1 Tax=Actinokineospora alba TaxID=504798 RepID=A0A1H0FL52_9PSEU|nr:polysaccharide deacetylase family protein [Actinokineospora alba]TDP69523.1 peptidoglycan/xylan/chitin deacetylase (PgdA/CDA1 family) [Actinokineospora alba]SDI14945.1 Peptidoglycan/xylan/chitin deacetylase, PgdA/CDA1 family [Actinokineospora alba]SDN95383.1 Peptidoglycan/xylan/chitin deacetylase, PgdA/CDA1 family [Actinokineospora alba]
MITWLRTHRLVAVGASALVVLLVAVLSVVLTRGSDEPDVAEPGASTTMETTTTMSASATATSTTRPSPKPTTSTAPTTKAPPFPAALRGQDLTVLPTSRKVVALTFDAGANSAGLSKILATLSAKQVPATFFLTGTWARSNPAGVRSITAGGHRVGNHSMTHPHLRGMSDAAVADELAQAERAIRAAGADPRPWFRFPFGDRDARAISAVNAAGYVSVRWTVDTLGWKGTSDGITAAQVTERTLNALRPGEIVLMHIGSNPDDKSTLDADALPGMIDALRARGYGFVTMDAALG